MTGLVVEKIQLPHEKVGETAWFKLPDADGKNRDVGFLYWGNTAGHSDGSYHVMIGEEGSPKNIILGERDLSPSEAQAFVAALNGTDQQKNDAVNKFLSVANPSLMDALSGLASDFKGWLSGGHGAASSSTPPSGTPTAPASGAAVKTFTRVANKNAVAFDIPGAGETAKVDLADYVVKREGEAEVHVDHIEIISTSPDHWSVKAVGKDGAPIGSHVLDMNKEEMEAFKLHLGNDGPKDDGFAKTMERLVDQQEEKYHAKLEKRLAAEKGGASPEAEVQAGSASPGTLTLSMSGHLIKALNDAGDAGLIDDSHGLLTRLKGELANPGKALVPDVVLAVKTAYYNMLDIDRSGRPNDSLRAHKAFNALAHVAQDLANDNPGVMDKTEYNTAAACAAVADLADPSKYQEAKAQLMTLSRQGDTVASVALDNIRAAIPQVDSRYAAAYPNYRGMGYGYESLGNSFPVVAHGAGMNIHAGVRATTGWSNGRH